MIYTNGPKTASYHKELKQFAFPCEHVNRETPAFDIRAGRFRVRPSGSRPCSRNDPTLPRSIPSLFTVKDPCNLL